MSQPLCEAGPAEMKAVPLAANNLDRSLKELEQLITDLHDQLISVLRREPICEPDKTDRAVSPCDLSERLTKQRDIVVGFSSEIVRLLGLLEL